jgi:hypothetical protein
MPFGGKTQRRPTSSHHPRSSSQDTRTRAHNNRTCIGHLHPVSRPEIGCSWHTCCVKLAGQAETRYLGKLNPVPANVRVTRTGTNDVQQASTLIVLELVAIFVRARSDSIMRSQLSAAMPTRAGHMPLVVAISSGIRTTLEAQCAPQWRHVMWRYVFAADSTDSADSASQSSRGTDEGTEANRRLKDVRAANRWLSGRVAVILVQLHVGQSTGW